MGEDNRGYPLPFFDLPNAGVLENLLHGLIFVEIPHQTGNPVYADSTSLVLPGIFKLRALTWARSSGT